MARKYTTSKARQEFSDIVSRAEYRGDRTILYRRNKAVAAVVPMEDLELIERAEDEHDLKLIRKRRNEATVPWEQVKRQLGL